MSTITKSSKAKDETNLSEQQRQQHIEVAAYHVAERGGFNGGSDAENWLTAETEIDQLLAEGKL